MCAVLLNWAVQAVAHTGEVTAMTPVPGGTYLVTGGADFQVMSQAAVRRLPQAQAQTVMS